MAFKFNGDSADCVLFPCLLKARWEERQNTLWVKRGREKERRREKTKSGEGYRYRRREGTGQTNINLV